MHPVNFGATAGALAVGCMDSGTDLLPTFITSVNPTEIDPGIGTLKGYEDGSVDTIDEYVAIQEHNAAKQGTDRHRRLLVV